MSTEPRHPLRGLLISQFFGAFNDNAWKIIVIELALAAVLAAPGTDGADREAGTLFQTNLAFLIVTVCHARRHTEVEAILVNDQKYGQYFEAYFSRETGLLVAVTERFTEFEKEWTTEFADYRPVKGVLLPHFIRRRQGSASVSIHLQTAPDAESLSSSPPVHQASSDHRRRRDQPW